MAELHGDGRVLPERTAANVDRMVRATPAALVSRRNGVLHACARTGLDLGGVSSSPHSNRALFRCDAVADWHHSHGQLYVSELSGPHSWISAAGRPLPDAISFPEMDETAPHSSGRSFR